MLGADHATARRLLDTAPADLQGTDAWLLRRADVDLATGRMSAAKQEYLELLARLPALDAKTQARALIGLSGPVAQEGNLDVALQKLGEAIGILRGSNSPRLLGEALYGRGLFRMVQGDLDDADADFSQARIAFELAGDSLQMARLQGQQATLLALRNRHAEALAMWSAAADRFERFGDAEKFIDALGNCATEQLSLL
jgi:tetratricopeptide (TPR) repeat protein